MYDSGENETVACDDMSCSSAAKTRAHPIPIFLLPAGRDEDISVGVRQHLFRSAVPNSLH